MLSESDEDEDSFEFLAPSKKIQKQGSGAGASSKAKAAPNGLTKTASTAQAGKDRPSSGGARSNSAGGSGKPSAKPRPLVASTTKVGHTVFQGLDGCGSSLRGAHLMQRSIRNHMGWCFEVVDLIA